MVGVAETHPPFALAAIERLSRALGASEARLEMFQEMQGQAIAAAVANARASWEETRSDLMGAVSLSNELADSNFESIQSLKAENARLVKQNKRLNAAVCLERDKGGGRLAYERELRERIEDLEASVRNSEKLVADAIDGKIEPPTASEIEARLWDTLEDEERTLELEEGVRQFSARLTQGERWHAMKALEAGRRTPVEVLQALGMACAVDRVDSYEQLRAAGVKCTPAQIEDWTDTEVREAVDWADRVLKVRNMGPEEVPEGWIVQTNARDGKDPPNMVYRAFKTDCYPLEWRSRSEYAARDARKRHESDLRADAPGFLRGMFSD